MFRDNYKKVYKNISPSNKLIQATIESTARKEALTMNSALKKVMTSIAIVLFIFAACVNVSPAFAASLQNIPVINTLSKIFSIHSYIEKTDDYGIIVDQPAVENQFDLNQEIEETIAQYKMKAEKSILDYKEAYLATGGTEEGFKEKNINIMVDYEIKADNEQYASFVLEMVESWIASSTRYEYYNLDSKTGEKITLQDILGDDYIQIVNQSIQSQIIASDYAHSYFTKDKGGFVSITQDTNFYINQAGNPVIVFDKYEIANGAMGRPEFEIQK